MAALLLLAVLAPVSAVTLNYTLGVATTLGLSDQLLLCNSSFDAANATGIYYYTPTFNQDVRFGAAATLAQNKRQGTSGYGLQASLLYTPGSQNYLNNTVLGYDACTFAFNILALTPNTWLRGQYEDGTCVPTFDSTCVNDLKSVANAITTQVNQPTIEISGALSTVCQQLLSKITAAAPDSCKPYLTGEPMLSGTVDLTQSAGTNTSILMKSCTIEQNGTTWYNVNTQITDYSDGIYDLASTISLPLMTIFMPAADNKVQSRILAPETVLSCLHIDHFNDGSRVAVAVGTPTPLSSGNATMSAVATSQAASASGISAGAIAGIVVGVVVVLGVAVGVWLFLSRRRRRQQEPAAVEIYTEPKYDRAYKYNLNELSPDSAKTELPTPYAELAGTHHQHHEMEVKQKFHEME